MVSPVPPVVLEKGDGFPQELLLTGFYYVFFSDCLLVPQVSRQFSDC